MEVMDPGSKCGLEFRVATRRLILRTAKKDGITQMVRYRLHVRFAHKMAIGSEPVRAGA